MHLHGLAPKLAQRCTPLRSLYLEFESMSRNEITVPQSLWQFSPASADKLQGDIAQFLRRGFLSRIALQHLLQLLDRALKFLVIKAIFGR
jgi:hypothetical protein